MRIIPEDDAVAQAVERIGLEVDGLSAVRGHSHAATSKSGDFKERRLQRRISPPSLDVPRTPPAEFADPFESARKHW